MSDLLHCGISSDIGFPTLSKARRRTLLVILGKAEKRLAMLGILLQAMDKDRATNRKFLKVVKECRKRYARQAELVLLQYPEGRADHRGKYRPSDARTNEQLNTDIRAIDRVVAD